MVRLLLYRRTRGDNPTIPFTESCLVSDELLQYRHFASKQLFDKDLSDDQEEEVLAQFAALDPEKKGHIEWSDFLYFESLAVLKKLRTEVTRCCSVVALGSIYSIACTVKC